MHVAATTHQHLHASQLLASLHGCQLELRSLKHEHEPTSIATRVFKCGCKQLSREQCPLIPAGLPVV